MNCVAVNGAGAAPVMHIVMNVANPTVRTTFFGKGETKRLNTRIQLELDSKEIYV